MNPVPGGSTRYVAEIVIAGAGLAGIAAAHQLAVREGVGRVAHLTLDRARIPADQAVLSLSADGV